MTLKEKDIIEFVIKAAKEKFPVKKVILFGSRSKKFSLERSDYDFAIDAPRASEMEWLKFSELVQENAPTLCQIDLIWLNMNISDKLRKEIINTGKTVYESRSKKVHKTKN